MSGQEDRMMVDDVSTTANVVHPQHKGRRRPREAADGDPTADADAGADAAPLSRPAKRRRQAPPSLSLPPGAAAALTGTADLMTADQVQRWAPCFDWLRSHRGHPEWMRWWATPLPAHVRDRYYRLIVGHSIVALAPDRQVEALVQADVLNQLSERDVNSVMQAASILGDNEVRIWHHDLDERWARPWSALVDYWTCLWSQGGAMPSWDAMLWYTGALLRATVAWGPRAEQWPPEVSALVDFLASYPRATVPEDLDDGDWPEPDEEDVEPDE